MAPLAQRQKHTYWVFLALQKSRIHDSLFRVVRISNRTSGLLSFATYPLSSFLTFDQNSSLVPGEASTSIPVVKSR